MNSVDPIELYQLTDQQCNKKVTDVHLDIIYCRQWRRLPPHLEMLTSVVYDIDHSSGDEGEKRLAFFRNWKSTKGQGATYKILIDALLKIACRENAESVCQLCAQNTPPRTQEKLKVDVSVPLSTEECSEKEKLEKQNDYLTKKLESCQKELNSLRKTYSIHYESCDQEREIESSERKLLILKNASQSAKLEQKEMECERLKKERDSVQRRLNELHSKMEMSQLCTASSAACTPGQPSLDRLGLDSDIKKQPLLSHAKPFHDENAGSISGITIPIPEESGISAAAAATGPSTSTAGPSTSTAGPSTSTAGPSTSTAGPSTTGPSGRSTTGRHDYLSVQETSDADSDTIFFLNPKKPSIRRVPHGNHINYGSGRTIVALAEGHNPYRHLNICLCVSLTVALIVFALIPSVAIGTVVSVYKCQDYGAVATVFPGDTVLAAELTDCQWNTSLKPTKTPRNVIDVYVAPCSAVKVHSEEINYTSIRFPDVTIGNPIIDEHSIVSNYFVENTTVTITTRLGSSNSMEAFMCLFRNSESFSTFLYPEDKNRFLNVMNSAIRCDKIQLAPNTSSTHEMMFSINDTDYYYHGISPSYSESLSFLQYNLSISRNFYNHSDFLNYLVSCSFRSTRSNCSINNSYSNSSTCVMLYARSSIDINGFNYIAINAEGFPVDRRPVFIPALTGSILGGCAVLGVCVTSSMYIYCRHCKRIMTRFQNTVQY